MDFGDWNGFEADMGLDYIKRYKRIVKDTLQEKHALESGIRDKFFLSQVSFMICCKFIPDLNLKCRISETDFGTKFFHF